MAGVLGKLVVSVVGDYRDLEKSLKKVQGKISGFNKQINKMSKGFIDVGRSATKYLTLPIMAALTAIAAIGVVSIKLAADLQESMLNVNTVMGVSEEQLTTITDEILTMSKELPQSAKILAEGLYDIAGSGFAGADAMIVLEAAAKAASAGVTDTAISARGIVAVLNAYALGAEDAEYVSDAMFATVDKGVITFAELAGSIGDVVSTAKIAGVDFSELSGFIAYLTTKGINAAETTTSLNRQILAIISPSEELQKVFKASGYETGELALKELGLLGVMELVNDAAGGSITKMKQLFPETRAMKGANAELSSGYEDLENFMSQFIDVSGSTEKALKEQSKGFKYQLQILKNNFAAIGIEIGNKFLPALTSLNKVIKTTVIPALEDLADYFGPIIEEGMEFIPVLAEIASQWLPIIVDKIKTLVNWFMNLEPIWKKVIVAAVGFAAAIGPVLIIIGGIISAIGTIISPIGLIIVAIVAGITALIAIGVLIWKNWDKIKAKAIEIWGAISNFFINLWVSIGAKVIETWDSIRDFFVSLWEKIKQTFQNAWEWIKRLFYEYTPLGIIIANWDEIVTWFSEMWERLKEIFKEKGEAIWQWMRDWIPFLNIIVENWDEIVAYLKEKWDIILGFFIKKGTAIKNKTTEIWTSIGAKITEIWNSVKAKVTKIWNPIRDKIVKIWNFIKTKATKIWNSIKGKILEIWTSIKTKATEIWTSVRNKIIEIWNSIKAKTTERLNSVKNFLRNTWNSIISRVNTFRASFLRVWDRIKDGLKSPLNAAIKLINSFLSKIEKAANSMIRFLSPIMPGLKGLKVRLPKIPQLALGGTIKEAGFVDIGERGRERIFLPKGAEVIPLTETKISRYQTIHIHNEYNEELASKTFARLFAQYVGVINK